MIVSFLIFFLKINRELGEFLVYRMQQKDQLEC